MEAIFLVCGARRPQLKREPLGSGPLYLLRHCVTYAGLGLAATLGPLTLPLSAQAYETYCLPQSQLKLAGVELGDSSIVVLQLLGPPLQETKDSSTDDGGVYSVRHLRYPHLLVDLGRDRVELLATSSSKVSLPSGIRVGMTIQEVGRLLRLPNAATYLRGDTLAPINCLDGPHESGLSGLDLVFEPARTDTLRRLARIRLSQYGP